MNQRERTLFTLGCWVIILLVGTYVSDILAWSLFAVWCIYMALSGKHRRQQEEREQRQKEAWDSE